MVISNHNSFWLLFDKIAFVYFIWKIYLYFSIENGQPRELAQCQLYRRTFVPIRRKHYISLTVSPAAFRRRSQFMARVPARVECKAVAVDRVEKLREIPDEKKKTS